MAAFERAHPVEHCSSQVRRCDQPAGCLTRRRSRLGMARIGDCDTARATVDLGEPCRQTAWQLGPRSPVAGGAMTPWEAGDEPPTTP